MIDKAEIISQPLSGQFTERIYDNQSAWNSQSWTWVKFTNIDLTEWCGQFRGFPRQVAVSKIYNSILVLTSDYLFHLDSFTANIVEFEDQPQFHNLTGTPNGDFIIADYYNIEKITSTIKSKIQIDSPINMDSITFKNWTNNQLEFTCDEFLNWDRHLIMELDCETDEIKIKSEN